MKYLLGDIVYTCDPLDDIEVGYALMPFVIP